MTFTINETMFYIAMTVILAGVQIYQQKLLRDLQKENKRLWEQAATSAIVLFGKVEELNTKVNDK